ncbi:MAG: methylated-DNA--[protein]-cysteine S-methyltransferase [Cyclobacteriaceae bacterium]|nr:methylated-DNA--[protein]-cysteine S-methyltransferase [Cyclobacteriaceae bacterium HetDA_MAG_MS6]
MEAGVIDGKLCLLEFSERSTLTKQWNHLKKLLQAEVVKKQTDLHGILKSQLSEYFDGRRSSFDLPMTLPGSAFQQRVWQELLKVPYGKTRSYLKQSEALGDVKAIRAVAKANGDNRIAIVVPCHRIIGSDGNLTGYAGKIWRKKYLLELEGAIAKQPRLF